jgi:LuxR family maltose regulon positive regulatory protein
VYARASGWFERTGDIDRAVHHALRADDLARAERLVSEHGPLYHTSGRSQTVKRWLDAIPKPYVLDSPGLCLAAAITSLGIGDGEASSSWSRFAEHALAHGHGDPNGEIGLRLLVFRSMLDVDDIDVSLASATRACDELPPGLWRGVALMTRGALNFELGDDDAAIEMLSKGASDLHVVGAPTVEAVCRAHLSIVLGERNQWSRALDVARAARQLMRDRELEHMPTLAVVTAASAVAEAMDGDPEAARSEILLTRGHLAFLHSVVNWHHLQARIALAHASLLIGDLVGARTLLAEAESLLQHRAEAQRPKEQVAELASQLRSARGVLACGPSALTTAELRVLHYLPTNLTHEEIARRLYISRNTAKSHSAAIYRKLGAASRSEAVELARTSGLLAVD